MSRKNNVKPQPNNCRLDSKWPRVALQCELVLSVVSCTALEHLIRNLADTNNHHLQCQTKAQRLLGGSR